MLYAGVDYPKGYFKPPIDIAFELSGNFGELRPNHFHTGIDITTNNKEGYAIKAAAEGYVSRIKVSPWGYGKAIYITHPNGYTTVYAHLQRYNGKFAEYVSHHQQINESFEIEVFPAPGELPVKQSEIIAYSGNTGSSGGPHLHFEIRDTKTEDALNPLLFGFPVPDTVAPVPVMLAIYPLDDQACVNGKNQLMKIPLKKSGRSYFPANAADSIVVHGNIGFAIEAYDKESKPRGKNGVYCIALLRNGKKIYGHQMERIPFDKSRYINCFVDYALHEKTGKHLMRSWLEPNNELPVYDPMPANRGVISYAEDVKDVFWYDLSDLNGNTARVTFKVTGKAKSCNNPPAYSPPVVHALQWEQTNNISEEGVFDFITPEKAVYDNVALSWKTSWARYGRKIMLGDPNVPLHKACTLKIYCNIPDSLQKKALIAETDAKGKTSSLGGSWDSGGVITTIKEFSTFSVMIDTIAPQINPFNFDKKGKNTTDLNALKTLQFTVADNLSGIGTYKAFIDGKWVLMEYEPKKKMMFLSIEKFSGKSEHELIINVTDKYGNTSVYTRKFIR
ncbi:MAG: M23 family metallopeptidase [Bacteroidia bacterium]